jgi:hypothetical protein
MFEHGQLGGGHESNVGSSNAQGKLPSIDGSNCCFKALEVLW